MLTSPWLGPAARTYFRQRTTDSWTEVGAAEGRANLALAVVEDKRVRAEAGGAWGSTRLGWASARLTLTCDDEHTTRALFFSRNGRRLLVRVDPDGSATGKPSITGTGRVTSTLTVDGEGRTFAVVVENHGDWVQGAVS